MKLTPIPKKGAKRLKNNPNSALQARHVGGDDASTSSSIARKLAARRAARKKITLLDLPESIIVDIFLASRHFAFPRCHPLLGLILSQPYVLRRLIGAAFNPTWDLWFGCAAEDVATYSLPIDLDTMARRRLDCVHSRIQRTVSGLADMDRFGGNAKFQMAILEEKWLTIYRLLNAQQVWLRTHRRPGPVYYRVPSPEAARHSLERPDVSFGREGFVDGDDFSVKDQFQLEYAKAVQVPGNNAVPLPEEWARLYMYPVMLEKHPQTRIPERLVTGPWSDGDARMLFWLGRAGAKLDQTNDWEIANEGLDRLVELARLSPDERAPGYALLYGLCKILDMINLFGCCSNDHALATKSALKEDIKAEMNVRKMLRPITAQSRAKLMLG